MQEFPEGMTFIRLLVLILRLAIMTTAIDATAQSRDSDGDGLDDPVGHCPNVAGPRRNNGCPVRQAPDPTATPTPGDRDGDGTMDVDDECPEAGGPCLLATQGRQHVNVRTDASTDAPINGQISPTLKIKADDGAWVVRTGGDCGLLPTLQLDTQAIQIGDRTFAYIDRQPGGFADLLSCALDPLAGVACDGAAHVSDPFFDIIVPIDVPQAVEVVEQIAPDTTAMLTNALPDPEEKGIIIVVDSMPGNNLGNEGIVIVNGLPADEAMAQGFALRWSVFAPTHRACALL